MTEMENKITRAHLINRIKTYKSMGKSDNVACCLTANEHDMKREDLEVLWMEYNMVWEGKY